jgi:protoglobin
MTTVAETKMVAEKVPAYTYGTSEAARSPISLKELDQLKQSVGFTGEDEKYLKLAGEVLTDQTKELVDTWRGVIAKAPHLAKHSRDPNGKPIAHYTENSGLRFQQWILDTCFRPYDQDWLNYQQEMALRHTGVKKNKAEGVDSTPYIPLRDVIAFTAVINDTIKPFLAKKGHGSAEVDKMHSAWCKSLLLQTALWAQPYTDTKLAPDHSGKKSPTNLKKGNKHASSRSNKSSNLKRRDRAHLSRVGRSTFKE